MEAIPGVGWRWARCSARWRGSPRAAGRDPAGRWDGRNPANDVRHACADNAERQQDSHDRPAVTASVRARSGSLSTAKLWSPLVAKLEVPLLGI
jgi:hypothetical protein